MNRRPLLCGLPVLLAGCAGSLLPKPAAAPRRFSLDDGAPPPVSPPPQHAAPVLVLVTPRAAASLDGHGMVYSRRPNERAAYAFHEWVDPPAQMLAPLLLRALQARGGFRAVLLAPSAATGALRLETELTRLHQDFSVRPSQLRLTLRALLLDAMTRQVLAGHEFDQVQPCASDDAEGGVAAAQQAAQALVAALAEWCADAARGRLGRLSPKSAERRPLGADR
jgi:cholesterol transport system auxiliary component